MTTEERLRWAELIAAIANDAATSEDLDELLRSVLERLRDAIRFKGGSLALPDDDGHLRIRTAVGIVDDAALAVRIAPGTGIVGTVFTSGRSFRTGDLDAERRVAPAARDVGTNRLMRSFLCVPLTHRGRVFGILEIDSSEPDAFSEHDQTLVETAARVVAGVVRLTVLAESERRAVVARDDFFAAVSHDLRSPLTVIRGQAQRLMRQHRDDADGPPLASILSQSDRLGRIIAGLIDVARKRAGEPLLLDRRDGDLGAFVAAVARSILGPEQQSRLVIDVPATLGRFDRSRVEQILANLVDNATKYAPSGTPIEIQVTAVTGGAEITVSDHGPGVPAAERPTIFDRFVRGQGRGSAGGHGLGLYIVRLAAEAHGGEVTVADRDDGGNGAAFRIRLAFGDDESADPPEAELPRALPR